MKYVLEKRFLFFLVAIFIAYIVCSQVYINQLSNKIEKERERVINIARTLELWKDITINLKGHFDLEKLHLVNSDLNVTKIERDTAELGINEGEKLYAVYYSRPVNENMYRRYFSELVLGNYFYLVTDSDGKIQELFWDKP
tara:strand:- start:779 stop:1201 length:423 start_codon:yes stop_codon:yes gene_type:complete